LSIVDPGKVICLPSLGESEAAAIHQNQPSATPKALICPLEAKNSYAIAVGGAQAVVMLQKRRILRICGRPS
jgi:hypothetical protein